MTEMEKLLARLEPELRAAFLAAIGDMREGVDYTALLVALKGGDIDAAIAALNIDAGAFAEYASARYSSYIAAGALISRQISRASAAPTFRFDMTNPRAEAKIRGEAGARIVGYTQEQIEVARRVIGDGFARGEGPQTIAVDIAGRVNKATGRREGGIIGLSSPQEEYTRNMRLRLLSGDRAEMMKVLGRFDKAGKWVPGTGMTLRDRRYDAAIKRAIASGKPIPRATVDKMVARYTDRLIAKRARDIARTDTAQGVMSARMESVQQALDKAGLPDEAVEKEWRHRGGLDHARAAHVAMNKRKVQGLSTPFHLPNGAIMQHSHDPIGGAANNANCRCDTDFRIDFSYGVA